MKLSSLMLLIFPVATLLVCYILIQLNPEIILVDLLFVELEIKKGILVVFSFLLGTFFALLLELINYLKLSKSKTKKI